MNKIQVVFFSKKEFDRYRVDPATWEISGAPEEAISLVKLPEGPARELIRHPKLGWALTEDRQMGPTLLWAENHTLL